MDNNWIIIFSSSDTFRIEVMKGMLQEHDIEAVIVNKKDSAYLFGEAELFVKMDDAFRANQVISEAKE
jgi:hypothetical protein